MLDAARKALRFARWKTRKDLDDDEILTLALVRLLEIVGEAARYIPDDVKQGHPEFEWRAIAGMNWL